MRPAPRTDATWIAGAVILLLAGFVLAWVYHKVPVIERYFERTMIGGCRWGGGYHYFAFGEWLCFFAIGLVLRGL